MSEGKPPRPRVACIGECMIELRERPDGLLSRSFGGDTLNTATYLARLGVVVDYVTALGTDPFSEAMLAAWREEGVGTSAVVRAPARLPGLYMIQTDAAGERRFSYWREAAPVRDLFRFPEAEAIEAALPAYDLVYLSGITLSLFTEGDRQRLFAALDAVRARGGRIAFDSNFRPRGWPDRDAATRAYRAMLRRSDIAFVSAEDVALLTGRDVGSSDALTAWLADDRMEAVLRVSIGDCDVRQGGQVVPVPYRAAAQVLDTTAAGDSFAAGYLAARLRGEAPETSAHAGHALAGIVIQHVGAIIPRGAMPGAGGISAGSG